MVFRNKAFTLLEILIVVSVLAILIVIVVPRIKGFQDQAKISKVKSELKTVQAALESYAIHHNGIYPDVDAITDFLSIPSNSTPQMIDRVLYDPFGGGMAEYQYSVSPDGKSYAVASKGPDGINGTADVVNAGNVPTSGDDLLTTNGTATALDVQADENNCGTLGTACANSETCTSGNCVFNPIANGEVCTQNSECASGACGGAIPPICLAIGSTPNGGGCSLGSTCQTGYCNTWWGQCSDGATGRWCNLGTECQTGQCTLHNCSDRSLGSPCATAGDCSSNYCSSGGRCTDRQLTSPCSSNADCDSTYCNTWWGQCSDGATGRWCNLGTECQTGQCTLHNCSDRSLGSPCATAGDCSSNYCSSGGRCTDRQLTSPCSSNADCDSTYCNTWWGQCSDGATGRWCNFGTECVSGTCASHNCT